MRISHLLFSISILIGISFVGWSQNVDTKMLRREAARLQAEGNWKDAYQRWEQILRKAEPGNEVIPTDLSNAVQCLNQLGRQVELDSLLADVVSKHSEDWKLIKEAVKQLAVSTPYGVVSDKKFYRNPQGQQTGQWVQVQEQDRQTSLKWLAAVLPIVEQQPASAETADFYLQLANAISRDRRARQAWRLNAKTDIDKVPDYLDFESPMGSPERFASVDSNGNPVLHSMPSSWSEAKTDGERFRWALAQVVEMNKELGDQAKVVWADFLNENFSVDTLQQDMWFSQYNAKSDKDTSGIYAIHTLEENEAIARLANGIKRFELPDEHNPIRVLQDIANSEGSAHAETALERLWNIFLNRRQYPKAAEYLQRQIQKFGPGGQEYRQVMLDNILQPRGGFDPVPSQVAGKGAKLSLVYRNAKSATFSALPVDLEMLIKDIKAFYREAERGGNPKFGGIRDMQYAPPIQNPGELFSSKNIQKYVRAEVANWSLKLEPRENHWDRRIDVTTPLQKAGLYVVTANFDDGAHAARCLVWIQDTAIVRKSLDKSLMYYFADAESGKPLAGMNVEIFGFTNIYDSNSQPKLIVKNFAKKSDNAGQVVLKASDLPEQFQWMTIARDNAGRVGILGLEGTWIGEYSYENFQEIKAFGVSDRPVYRPGDKVNAKFWIAAANYGLAEVSKPLSKRTFQVAAIDPQGKIFYETQITTDEFGGGDISFELPKKAMLGAYSFHVKHSEQEWIPNSLSIRVEEYRKPEFEVNITAPEKPVTLGDKIQAKIKAKYYFGSPVTEASVSVRVTREAYNDTYYPVRPYDWCYGPGYWWYAYDYPWYPGWSRWVGCRMPDPWWMPRFSFEPPELVIEQELRLDENGEATIEIDSALAKEVFGDQDHRYSITAEVRDSSRRTIVAQGQVIAARQAFKIYSWLENGFYQVGDEIIASFEARALNGTTVQGTGKLELLRISYDKQRKPVETLVEQWNVKTDEDGQIRQQMTAGKAGQYRLKIVLDDGQGHVVEGGYIFTVRGGPAEGKDFRYTSLELIPDKAEYAVGDTVRLQINADRDDALVMLFIRPVSGIGKAPQYIQLAAKSKTIDIEVDANDQPNFFVEALTVFDGELHQSVREIIVPPENRVLNVKVDASKSEYLPGEEAEVNVTVTDPAGKPVKGSTTIAVYDRSLEQIAPEMIPGDIREFFWKWRRSHNVIRGTNLDWLNYPLSIAGIYGWAPLGIFGQTQADDFFEGALGDGPETWAAKSTNGMMGRNLRGAGMGGGAYGGGAVPGAPMEMAMLGAESEMAGGAMAKNDADAPQAGVANAVPSVRKDFADAALWLARIDTDAKGQATAKFKMPENLSGWKLRSWAVGSGVRVGSGSAETVTRKNLLVRLQTPRFLVERDEVVLSAIVHNDLAVAKDVRVWIEIDGETQLQFMPESKFETTVHIESHGQVRIDWRCRAIAEGVVKVRALAATDVESDAMQLEVPVLVNGILKTDSFAGTVRPDQANGQITINIPEDRRVDQSRLVVRLSPSLATSMIDALPYMAEYPYGCTEQTLNRFLPTVITQRILQEMNIDLARLKEKRNNLNAQELGDAATRAQQWKRFDRNPVYDVAEVNAMVAEGVQKLTDMQMQDGGWGWFSGTGEHSSAHTTAVVVRGLLVAQKNDIAIVPDVLERGLAWLDQYQAGELQRLKNAATNTQPSKQNPDSLDALVFHILVSAGRVQPEMQTFLYEKREAIGVYGKAILALATHAIGNADQTAMLRQNIEQFLVEDEENETAFLQDNSPWWYWYGSNIESAAMYLKLLAAIDPQGKTAPRLVKYLLNNRKHSTYWNSTRDTALVVEAFGDYLRATGEGKSAVSAEVYLDDKRLGTVEFTSENLFEVDNTIQIFGNAVPAGEHKLEIRRKGDGPMYWNAYLTNFTLEEEIQSAGLEVKIERRFYRVNRVKKDLELADDQGQVVDAQRTALERIDLADLQALPSGTMVEVELLIESKNDYEYLIIEDRKPAGLESIDTQSGYVYTGVTSVYREFRDQKTDFFIRWLPQGKHSMRYQLRAEAPGIFTALPAQITGMYAPELVGNSADFDLRVED
jgi:alpha-2-macroglobulin